jgi:hypothetical protein
LRSSLLASARKLLASACKLLAKLQKHNLRRHWNIFSPSFYVFFCIFRIFLKTHVIKNWDRCYDHNFLRVLPISAKKFGVFLKNQCYDHNFA